MRIYLGFAQVERFKHSALENLLKWEVLSDSSYWFTRLNAKILLSLSYIHLKSCCFWAENTSKEAWIKAHFAPLPSQSPLFSVTFGSPINNLCSEHRAPVFCGCVKPEMCWTELLFERLLMSQPFCSLIAHHLGTVPLTSRLWRIALLNDKEKATTPKTGNVQIISVCSEY